MRNFTNKISFIFIITSLSTQDLCIYGNEPKNQVNDGQPPLPWHLVDLIVKQKGSTKTFEKLSADIIIMEDVPPNENLMIAISGKINNQIFYIGLQSHLTDIMNIKRPGIRTPDAKRGMLFSRWGDDDINAIRASDGGLYLASDHEGKHVSVKREIFWNKGRYTITVSKLDQENDKGTNYIWYGAFIHSHESGEYSFLGSLRFLGTVGELYPNIGGFVEIYGHEYLPKPATLSPSRIIFCNWMVNNTAVIPERVCAVYYDSVPLFAKAFSTIDFVKINKELIEMPLNHADIVVQIDEKPANVSRPRVNNLYLFDK